MPCFEMCAARQPKMGEMKVAQSCLTLRDPMDRSPPGLSIHGVFQARALEGVAIAFSKIHTTIYKMHTTHKIHTAAAAANLLQSCLTLGDPRDGSPSGSAIPGILQARTLEWVAIAFSSYVTG